jgi:hypothetical protein
LLWHSVLANRTPYNKCSKLYVEVHLSYASQTNITQGSTVPADYKHLIEVFGNIVSEDGILLVSWVDFGRAINVTKG